MIAAMSMFFIYAFSSDNAKHLRITGRQMQDEPVTADEQADKRLSFRRKNIYHGDRNEGGQPDIATARQGEAHVRNCWGGWA
jgi:hypothetical protein